MSDNKLDQASVQALADKAVAEEKALEAAKQEFALQNAEFAAFLKTQTETQKKIDEMWASVKSALVEADYTDVIDNENFRISVSKVLGIKVVDLDAVPEEYTETVKVAKPDKLKKHYELYGALPTGTVDNSYWRLNKKVK